MGIPVYSFKHHYLDFLREEATSLFPGYQYLITIYYDKSLAGLNINAVNHLGQEEPLSQKYIENVLGYRKQKVRHSWISTLDLAHENKALQLPLDAEFNHHTLLIRFPDSPDRLSDLLLIQFKNDDHIFKLSAQSQKLGVPIKDAVANLLVRMTDQLRKQILNDAHIFSLINHSERFREKTKAAQIEQQYSRHFEDLVAFFSKEFINESGYNVSWSSEAIKTLQKQNLSVSEIKKAVHGTLIVAINQSDVSAQACKIESADLVFPQPSDRVPEQINSSVRYERTLKLLNRYEKAAVILAQKGLPITGVNLGQACLPPISAAAISDALKKHKKKITTLLLGHPNQWTILRNHFKPVQNLIYQTKVLNLKVG